MDPLWVGILSILILFVSLACGVHIAVALGLSGFLGASILLGMDPALQLLALTSFKVPTSYTFFVVPMFILMGNFAMFTGIGESAFRMANRWMGSLPGGLAIAATFACGLFAAASGSSMATTATFTPMALPEMLKRKYSKQLIGGALAAAGTLGSLIPPSALMVIYGIFTEQPIGKLLMAGIIPGVLSLFAYMSAVFLVVKMRPHLAPERVPKYSWKEKLRSVPDVGGILFLVFIVLGGMYAGICTPTEAGALGAFGTFLLMGVKRKINRENVGGALAGAVQTTCMLFILIVGAMILSRTLALCGLQSMIINLVVHSGLPPLAIVGGFVAIFYILGMFLDPTPMMALTLPTMYPIISSFGLSGIWFGVIVIKCIEVGLVTPPLGLNVFVSSTASRGVLSIEDCFKGVIPFIIADSCTIAILFAFPQIVLWLPEKMM